MIKVAITGNIASGKSEVESILQKMGYKVFDTDKISHEILDNNQDVKRIFKDYDIFENDNISRKKLGNLVFNNKELRKKLENIIHPQVKNKLLQIFKEENGEEYIFISIPLLFEANMQNIFDKIIFVYCDNNIRLKRLMLRNNLTQEEALSRINSQQPQGNKMPLCDYIVENNSSKTELEKQIKNLF